MTAAAHKPAADAIATGTADQHREIVDHGAAQPDPHEAQPEMLWDVTVQPIMFVCCSRTSSGRRSNPGSSTTRSGCCPGSWRRQSLSPHSWWRRLTNDVEKGIIDRFRSLPMSRSSVLVGRSVAA